MKYFILILLMLSTTPQTFKSDSEVIIGAARTSEYLPILKGKRVALFSNQSGIVGTQHVLDILLSHNINVVLIVLVYMLQLEN